MAFELDTKNTKGTPEAGVAPVEVKDQPEAQVEQTAPVEARDQSVAQDEQAPQAEQPQVEQAVAVEAPQAESAPQKSERVKALEEILSKDLKSIYVDLPEGVKAEFMKAGVALAVEIDAMAKLKTGRIKRMVDIWMKMVPNVKKPHLETVARNIVMDIIAHLENRGGEDQNQI